jgi:transcriptional regulator with XRE-family HTH domain
MSIPRTRISEHDNNSAAEVLNDRLPVEIGRRIRRAREESRMSQTELGQALGYKTSMVSAFETGSRRLKLEDLARLCLVLDKEPEYFLRTDAIKAAHQRPVGLTLRAQLAELHHEPLTSSITAFLDSLEGRRARTSAVPDLHYLRPHGAARELLDRCDATAPPVDVDQVIRELRIPLVKWDFPDFLSAVIVEVVDDDYVIGVNKHHALNRRRFSIAHEVGHAVLRHEAGYYLEFFDASLGEPPNFRHSDEREANAFAAALLMDERWLREDWANGHRSVHELARRYRVSDEAMSFRLINLGLA